MSDVNNRYVIDQIAVEDEKLCLSLLIRWNGDIVCGKVMPIH